MTTQQLQERLQEISKDITIDPSQRPGLDSVNYKGVSLFAVPSNEIAQTPDESGLIEVMGTMVRHRSVEEAIAMVELSLKKLEDKDEHDAFFGLGEYK